MQPLSEVCSNLDYISARVRLHETYYPYNKVPISAACIGERIEPISRIFNGEHSWPGKRVHFVHILEVTTQRKLLTQNFLILNTLMIRSLQLKDATGTERRVGDIIGDQKSVVIFLRHLGYFKTFCSNWLFFHRWCIEWDSQADSFVGRMHLNGLRRSQRCVRKESLVPASFQLEIRSSWPSI